MALAVHIGYAKCATTFLQTTVFPGLPELHYLGRWYGEGRSEADQVPWAYDLVFRDHFSADRIGAEIEKRAQSGRMNLISQEVFLRPYKTWRTLRRLKSLETGFGPLKILVTLRNQTDLLLSRYMHDVGLPHFPEYPIAQALDFDGVSQCYWPQCAFPEKLEEMKASCRCRKHGVKYLNLPYYDYLRLWCSLAGLFEERNVHFIVTERLRSEPAAELKRLTDFLLLPALTPERVAEFGKAKANVQKNQEQYDRVKREFLGSPQRREIRNFFGKSNRILSDLAGLGLESLAYC